MHPEVHERIEIVSSIVYHVLTKCVKRLAEGLRCLQDALEKRAIKIQYNVSKIEKRDFFFLFFVCFFSRLDNAFLSNSNFM